MVSIAETATNRQRILRAVQLSSTPLDDDQLAQRVGITPRQAVNQICRRLKAEGIVDRVDGPDGKIVNILSSDAERPPSSAGTPVAAMGPALPDGHSGEQREAEGHLLAALSAILDRPLNPTTIRLPSGVRVEVDGADSDRTVLVECWAHIGKVKGAQRLKVLTDAFKLTWIANNIPGRPRLILCMADEVAAAPFRNLRAWHGQALADYGIEVTVVPLPAEVRASVLQAPVRQVR